MTVDRTEQPLREVRFEYSPLFPEILGHCRASLLVSTYQAGKLGVLGLHKGQLDISFHSFEQAMGVAVGPRALAIGTRHQIWHLPAASELTPQLQPPGRYDACYLTRQSHVTGGVQIHELAWGEKELWFVNTLFSCLCTVHEQFSFVPRWQPPFISSLAAEDRCHLNGMAMRGGAPAFVTAMSQTDTPAGWRPTKATSGIVLDVASQAVVADGLAMPHSPRWYRDRLWVLDSGRGQLSQVDLTRGHVEPVATLPGYTRGLAFAGQFAFVGLSRTRETAVFGGLPIQQTFPELKCGIGVIDLETGQNVAAFQFHSGVEEIFDVQVVPGVLNPLLRGPLPADDQADTIWLVPPLAAVPALDQQGSHSVFNRIDPPANATPSTRQTHRDWFRQGLALHEQGRLQESVAAYREALRLQPNDADTYNNLGNVYQDLLQTDEALECYRQAIRCNASYVNAYRNLGYALKEQGKTQEGLLYLEKAQGLEPSDIIRFVLATSLPPVYSSLAELRQRRRDLEQNVAELVREQICLDLTDRSAPTNFYSAYQGENDRSIQVQLGSLMRAPQPTLPAKRASPTRQRVGFISRHFRNHTIGRLNLGLVQHLPRDQFEVHVISVGAVSDALSQKFQEGSDHYWPLPATLRGVRAHLQELNLDILYYSDVGMDTLTYSLAMSRLAGVQCVSWGHPLTTGSPVMDYFVSSERLEVPEADEHYSEQLVRLPVVNSYYYRPTMPAVRDHAYFGLDPRRTTYLCFQNLFKIHPEFDPVLRGILERDPAGELVMMAGRHPDWTETLRARFRQTIGPATERIRFLPTQSHDDFMSLNALANVSLDPLHFGGGNTTYEALAVGLPVVTLPSRFLRGRITQALYQQMDFSSLVVDSPEAYIELAVRLGTDREYREATKREILARCSVLYEDARAVTSLAEFFSRLH